MDFRGDLDALTLAVLASGPTHGYEVMRRINERGDEALRIKEGQLYPILHRLESDGQIVAQWEPQQGKPARKVYQMTDAGQRLLAKKRDNWARFTLSVDALLNPVKEVSNA